MNCNAYCVPEEGLHAIIDYSPAPAAKMQYMVGKIVHIQHVGPGDHLPLGWNGILVSVSDAHEAPPSPDAEYPYAVLNMVHGLDEDDHTVHIHVAFL